MAKTKTLFVCQECGNESPRWVGKCPGCEQWNTLVEETVTTGRNERSAATRFEEKPVLLREVMVDETKRYVTGIREFDNVLGGGIVPGSVVLIGGDPGIGKSTLALQMSCRLSQQGQKILYVSGEESIQQTSMRAQRLLSFVHSEAVISDKQSETSASSTVLTKKKPMGDVKNELYIVNQIDVDAIADYVKTMSPDILVVDSIQVVYRPDISSTPGSVSQVRECAAVLTQMAKTKGMPVLIIGHVTKEGMIAGPRVLEHIVDTVLYFEGERYSTYRILRATKNRFGSTNEIGVFEMTSSGLAEVTNPSEIFLSERPQAASGSVVVPVMEGTRPFLVEVQALVSRSSFGMVRQKAQGFDANRLALLIAVLEKRLGLSLYDQDVFLNIVGGMRVEDPAGDLAVAMAIASAFLDKPLGFDTAVVGEVGLSSEVRSVSQIAARVNEAAKLGFKRCIIPKNNLRNGRELKAKNIGLITVETVKEALDVLNERIA